MAASGVYFSATQIALMQAAITAAEATQDPTKILAAVAQYYNAQIASNVTGDAHAVTRGYATLALQVVTGIGNGSVPLDEVSNALPPGEFDVGYRAQLALQLASADFSQVQQFSGEVPTLAQDAEEHYQVFVNQLHLPIAAWGGAAFVALGLDYTLGQATAAEEQQITDPKFSNLSESQVAIAIGNLAVAGFEAVLSPNSPDVISSFSAMLELIDAFVKKYNILPTSIAPVQLNEELDGSYQLAVNGASGISLFSYASAKAVQAQGMAVVNGTAVTVSGVMPDLSVSKSSVSVNADASSGVFGPNNSISAVGNNAISIDNTGGDFDTVYANGLSGETTGAGLPTGITVGSIGQSYVAGSGNNISVQSGGSVIAYGGANVVSAQSRTFVAIGSTDGNFDTIYANNDTSNTTTANGQTSGITLTDGSQGWVAGNQNNISAGIGVSLGAYGGANTISVGENSLVALGSTNGSFDTVYGSNDSSSTTTTNGQQAGISLDVNTQANVAGSFDTVSLKDGSSLGVYGQGDKINVTGTGRVLVTVGSTNGVSDTITASNVKTGQITSNGQTTGISLQSGAQASISGNSNFVSVAAGDTATVTGNNNSIQGASGENLTVLGSYNSITSSAGTSFGGVINITGNYETITVGPNTVVNIGSGIGDTIIGSNITVVGLKGASATITGSNDVVSSGQNSNFNISGNGEKVSVGSGSYVGLLGGSGTTISRIYSGW